MSGTIYPTFIERENCFIKIWGQVEKNLSIFIENTLLQMKPQFDAGAGLMAVETLTPGLLCCAKFKDESYYRARITNISLRNQGLVEVMFIDYGNRDFIQVTNLRSISNFPASVISMAAQAKDFILAKVQCVNSTFTDPTFEILSNEIRYLDFDYRYISQIGPYALLTISANGQDIAESFAARNLAIPIELAVQQMILENMAKQAPVLQPSSQPIPPMMLQKSSPPPMQAPPMLSPIVQPKLLTLKSLPLPVGSEHTVYVSYVTDGPCLFSIQLQKKEPELQELMLELNALQVSPLEETPLPGCVCLARSLEDNFICRAVVTSMVDDSFRVFFVDFGNTEICSFNNIFQIPFKYVIPKVMATRFALAGLQGTIVSLDMKVAFKDFVTNKLLQMRVASPSPTTALSLCELWDEHGTNVLDFVRGLSLQGYPDPVPLPRGFNQEVKVSYVFSCDKFYVQLRNKEDDLNQMMNNLQQSPMQPISESSLRVKGPCVALYEADAMYYRAEILEVQQGNVLVRYVDYGNEETIPLGNIKAPILEFITNLRPQAIECCLNGYQNMEKDQERDNLLEEIMLEQYFTMKVGDVQGSRILVDLFDKQQYNVASLLLDKIAKNRSQISPALVQEFNKIDQRQCKTTSSNQYSQQRENRGESKTDLWRDKDNKPPRQSGSDWRKQTTTFENSRNNSQPRENSCEKDGNSEFKRKPRARDNSWGEKRDDISFDSETTNHSMEFRSRKPRGGDTSWDDSNNRSQQRPERTEFKRKSPREENSWNDNSRNMRSSGFGDNSRSSGSGFGENNSRSSGFGENNSRSSGFGSNVNGDNPRPRRDNRQGRGGQDWGEKQDRRPERGGQDWGERQDRFNRRDNKSEESNEKNWSSGKSFKNKSDNIFSSIQSKDENVAYAELTTPFKNTQLTGTEHVVSISWFYNPSNFYCQIEENKSKFEAMMRDIQYAYRNRTSLDTVAVGNSVIALFPEDKAYYRAIIMENLSGNYKVLYVDFGNASLSSKIYKVEERFMELPVHAVQCSLLNVNSVGEKWPKADTFSRFFDKEKLDCKFENAIDSNSYIVELTSEGQSIKEELQKAGLIVIQNIYEHFDPNYLIMQQIYCKVDCVKSLSDFTLEILPGLLVTCAIYRNETGAQPNLDLLKSLGNQMVVAYVDDVQESKLFVTLYDMKGLYIPMIELQEEIFEAVNPICPAVIIGPYLNGYVSHAAGTSVFVQADYTAKNVEGMLEHLFEWYDTSEAIDFEVKEVVYAVKSSDGNWYRGLVTQIEDNAVTVSYIDYGNSETVEKCALRILHEEFFTSHLASEISLENAETYLDQEINLQLVFENDVWVGQIVNTATPQAQVQQAEAQIQPETVISTQSQPEVEISTSIPPEAVVSNHAEREEVLEESLQTQTIGFSVQLSHLDNPGQFYLQQSSALDAIDQLQTDLQSQIESLTDIETVTTGIICAAPYSADDIWYRAQVLDADSDITTVRFIDYGNTDVLSNDTKIKTLPTELLSFEEHAKRCSLFLSPANGEWSSEACQKFEELTAEAELTAEILHQDEKTTFVKLYTSEMCINDLFLEEKFAVELELETSPSFTGFVSHLNSPSEFWIQFEHACNDLELIAEQLTSAEKFKQLDDHAPGSLCAAIFPEDESWYRARILSNTVAGIEVLFIDYGNSCTCTSLRELPEELVMVPPLAHKCSLLKPEGLLEWPVSATDKFKEISADGVTVFTVIKHGQGETNQVQLLLNQDISQILKPQLFDATITYCTNLGNFFIRMIESTQTFVKVQQDIANLTDKPGEDEILIAALHENTWYRAKKLGVIVDQFVVELIDLGIEVDVREVRQLPKAIAEIEALALPVKMNPASGFAWGEDSEEHFKKMLQPENTVFQVEIVTGRIVRLYLNGHDIRMHIPSVKCTPASSVHSTPKKEVSRTSQRTEDIETSPILQSTEREQTASGEVEVEKNDEELEMVSQTSAILQSSEQALEELQAVSEFDKSDVTMKTIEITGVYVMDMITEMANLAADTVLLEREQSDSDVVEVEKNVIELDETESIESCNKQIAVEQETKTEPDSTYLYHAGLDLEATTSPTTTEVSEFKEEGATNKNIEEVKTLKDKDDEILKDAEMITTVSNELVARVAEQCKELNLATTATEESGKKLVNGDNEKKEELHDISNANKEEQADKVKMAVDIEADS